MKSRRPKRISAINQKFCDGARLEKLRQGRAPLYSLAKQPRSETNTSFCARAPEKGSVCSDIFKHTLVLQNTSVLKHLTVLTQLYSTTGKSSKAPVCNKKKRVLKAVECF